jgi:AraC-like DNA-binding protein
MFEDSYRGGPRIIRREFGDLDEIASRVKCAEILRRARGPFQAAVVSATLDPVALVWWSHTPPIIARAMVPAAYHLFLMRPDSGGAVLVDGHALDERRLVEHRPGTEMLVTTKAGNGCLRLVEILARAQDLDRASYEAAGRRFSSGPSLCTLVEPDERALSALRTLCATAFAAVENPDAIASGDSLCALARAVLSAVVAAVSSDPGLQHGHEWTRDFETRVVRRADAFLRAHVAEKVPLSRVCAAAGTSERQLQRAFRAIHGMGPNRYFKIRRLNFARAALLSPASEGTIARVASRFGFSDLGRFASAYRALFGEAPSTTFRRGRDSRQRAAGLSGSTYRASDQAHITESELASRLGEGSHESATASSATWLPTRPD